MCFGSSSIWATNLDKDVFCLLGSWSGGSSSLSPHQTASATVPGDLPTKKTRKSPSSMATCDATKTGTSWIFTCTSSTIATRNTCSHFPSYFGESQVSSQTSTTSLETRRPPVAFCTSGCSQASGEHPGRLSTDAAIHPDGDPESDSRLSA